jgi:hypothetical protein
VGVDLYWIPLGAGGHSVRLNGRAYEAVLAAVQRRPARDLYHSALVVALPEGTYAIEMAPVQASSDPCRGAVAEGPVGSPLLRRLRLFRYEVRCRLGGVIPDLDEAVDSPRRLTDDLAVARRIIDLVAQVPTHVWGRDELHCGDMWNSNSLVAWLIVRSGLDVDAVRPPEGGRAPGWDAGIVAAQGAGARLRRSDRRARSSSTLSRRHTPR